MPLYFRRVFSSCVVPALLLLVACEEEPTPQEGPTYHQDVAPILAANCLGCHNPEGMQPDVLFSDGESAQEMASMIAGAVGTGAMPPFYAVETEECPNPWGFARDPRLDDDEKAAITAWVAGGAAAGG